MKATMAPSKDGAERPIFRRIKAHDRLFLEVVRQIEERIVRGELKPGAMLPAERIMAEQFSVSRTVIREATKALELRGLVEVQHGRGVMVVTPSADGVADSVVRFIKIQESPVWALHELRTILEVEIAALAATRRTEEDLAVLSAIFRRMTETVDRPVEYVEHDFEFHRVLAKAAHNPLFPLVLEPYVTIMHEARRLGVTARNAPRRSVEFHKPLLEAVKKKDPEGARRAMRAHFEFVAEFIAEAETALAKARRNRPR
jgi:GntR family transcriptional repressor for pyruvate dehydrogenase complex